MPVPTPTSFRSARSAILIGGLIAATIDLTQACLLFGWDIPLAIAGGLIGPTAFSGGAAIYALGVLLHYGIALACAGIYYAASRRMPFLAEYPLVCGLFFGAAVDQTMRLIVLPISALHARGPYTLKDLLVGLGVHMIVIGLPIAYGTRHFSPPQKTPAA